MARTVDPYVKPTAAEVKKRWQACVDDMMNARRSFWLNEAFFHGEQWLTYSEEHQQLDILAFKSADDAANRTTVNKFKPRLVQHEARLLKTPLAFEPRPEGVDAEDIRRARIADQVLQAEAHRRDWEQSRADEVHYAMLGGVSAIAVEPDFEYKQVPAPDTTTGELVAMPSRPAVKLTALHVGEFGIEPGARESHTARWWIRGTTLTPEQARDFYELDTLPTADGQQAMSALHRQLLVNRRSDRQARVCMVYVLYERPSKRGPGGVFHVVGDKVVREYEWPFPWDDELNLWTFTQTRMSGTWKGDTFLNDARQIQVNYNRAYTTINNHLGKADNARIVMPVGAMVDEDDEMTGEVGEIIRVNPDTTAPFWMQPPQVARWLREHKADLVAELDDLFSAHEVSRGQAPGDRNSGLALSILAEKDETPLGLFAANQQRGWQHIAEWVLRLNRHLMMKASQHPDPAMQVPNMMVTDVVMSPGGVPAKVEWSAADIAENPVVHVPLESVMPRSQAAVQSAMIQLGQAFPQMFQSLGPAEVAAVLQMPDPTAFTRDTNPQLDLATWENGRMVVGADDNEVEIADWHDHDIHVQTHNKLRASAAYREAPDQVRQYIDLHIDAHAKLAQDEQMQQFMQQMQMQQMMAAQQGPPPAEAGEGKEPTDGGETEPEESTDD